MHDRVQAISEKGKQKSLPALEVGDAILVVSGKLLKVAQIHDEVWQHSASLADPTRLIENLKSMQRRPDVFTFVQRVSDVTPRYPYHFELENVAVATIDTFASWFERQVDRSVRKHVRKAQREGVVTKIAPFDDKLVQGICSIYNELSVRQGRKFWHYGKSFEQVKHENGTYLDRSIFLGAYFEGELIGFLKFVVDGEIGTIMQILSKAAYFHKRPTNAMLSAAVQICESRGVRYLIYGEHTYGKKGKSTLIDFKEMNGFKKIEFPRYYVPLTARGNFALSLGIHKGLADLVPERVRAVLVYLRSKYYVLRSGRIQA